MKVSLNRQQIDEALAQRNTDLERFVEAGRNQGKNIREIAGDLEATTGVPVTYRTLYRWLEKLEATA
jgi:transposase